MGSSYAAGAGIGPLVASSPKRCGQTTNSYPRLLAESLGLRLVNVSCGGATTEHILGQWSELPPQIEAVTPATTLVTITVGGNDIDYVRNLMIATCGRVPGMTPPAGRPCPPVEWPTEATYSSLEQRLRQIAQQIRQRAPGARIVIVDYLRILPDRGGCAAIPLDERDVSAARESFRRLLEVTRIAATAERVMLISAGEMSQAHDACSKEPWSAGYPGQPAPWHPTAAGHAAIAGKLAEKLR
jgi:lysophospholipase L1-like esterase